ncbi:MAG TPA: S8 family serine peptidase [Candidatus Deferrimicrobiaceae bacterium]|nr:S8 family serine peptidase [Candidatus Deferrimicrobiaceae bacterium]
MRRRPAAPLAAPTAAVVSALVLAMLALAPGGAPIDAVFAGAPDGRLVVLWRDAVPSDLADGGVSEHRPARTNPNRSVVVTRAGQTAAVAARLAGDPRVRAVVPDALGSVVGWPDDAAPNDTLWSGYQADMRLVGMPAAWRYTIGSPDVVVAVLDTGYELTHPDLQGIPVVDPYNSRNGSTSVTDGYGHGTHVAGTIAAATDNAIGVAGVAPGVTIMPVKVLDSNGYGYWSDFLEGVDWAVARGADVVNMSLGSGLSAAQVAAFQPTFTAAWQAGVMVVAAAGNNSNDTPFYPASFANVVSVSATNNSDTKANFSNFGPMVDVSAPGVGITSTYKGGTYRTMGGTSMATPHVVGLVALIRSVHPEYGLEAIETALKATALDLGDPGRDDLYGYGRIVAPAALAWSPPDLTPPVATLAAPIAGTKGVPETVTPVVAFDEAVTGADASSIALLDGAGVAVPASVSYDAAKKRATITPETRLASRTAYLVHVAGTIRDLAGNAVSGTSFGFTTGDTIDPIVVSVRPAPGRTGVRRGVTIRLAFSEPVTGVSKVTLRLKNLRTGYRVSVTVRYDAATQTATIDPTYRLMARTWYRIKVRDGIEDLAGHDLARGRFDFKTRR